MFWNIEPRVRNSLCWRGMCRLGSLSLPLLILTSAPSLAWHPADDLACNSDEFDRGAALTNWRRVRAVPEHSPTDRHDVALIDWSRVQEVEQWDADQLELWDVDSTQPGKMIAMPHTCVWFQDWRGPLAFKEVSGDFVFTTKVTVRGRDGVSIPQSAFSLAGIMVRAPRAITRETWTPAGENYVFLSLGHGAGDSAIFYEFEVKTTRNSNSQLELSRAAGGTATLQAARLGAYMIVLRRQAPGPWMVHRRYRRDDFPQTLQVGLTVYTDWGKAREFEPLVHNSTVLTAPLPPNLPDPNPSRPFAPDLIAAFEYARYVRPTLPPELEGLDLTNETLVPDEALLAFLGAHANAAGFGGCDANCDGVVDAFDIAPFLDLLFGGGVRCSACAGDVNNDGRIDVLDIGPFLACISRGFFASIPGP